MFSSIQNQFDALKNLRILKNIKEQWSWSFTIIFAVIAILVYFGLTTEVSFSNTSLLWTLLRIVIGLVVLLLILHVFVPRQRDNKELGSEVEAGNDTDHGVENWAIQTAWVMYLSGWVIAFLVVVAFAYYANSYIRYGDFYDWDTQRTFSRLEFSGWDNPRTMTGPSYWIQVMDSNAEAYEIDFFGRRGCIKPLTYPLNTSFRAEGSDAWGPMLDYQDHTPAESNAAGGIRLQAPDASPRSRKAVAIIEFPRALTLGDEDFCRSEELMKVWRLL